MGGAHSSPRRGGVARQLIEAGAKREPARSASAKARSLKRRAKPQLMVASAKRCAELTTPAAPLRWLRGILLMAQPPLLCEEGNITPPWLRSTVLRRGAADSNSQNN